MYLSIYLSTLTFIYRSRSLNDGECSADWYNFQESVAHLQILEEEVVESHKAVQNHRDHITLSFFSLSFSLSSLTLSIYLSHLLLFLFISLSIFLYLSSLSLSHTHTHTHTPSFSLSHACNGIFTPVTWPGLSGPGGQHDGLGGPGLQPPRHGQRGRLWSGIDWWINWLIDPSGGWFMDGWIYGW